MNKVVFFIVTLIILTSCDSGSKTNEYCYYGLEKFKTGDYQEAVELYSKAFELDSSNTEAIYMRGLSKGKLGDSRGALFDYSLLIKLSPNDAEAISLMADEKLNTLDSLGAFEDSERVIQIGSTNPDVYLRVGAIQMQLKKFEKAVASFSKAIDLNPAFGPAFYNRGIARYDLNQVDGACDDFKEAMKLGIPEAKTEIEENCK
jgi:tetratricopeptide (TPR) repeat protein